MKHFKTWKRVDPWKLGKNAKDVLVVSVMFTLFKRK